MSGRHRPSPSPMLVAASPDARLVSPWLGGQTPRSGGTTLTFLFLTFLLFEVNLPFLVYNNKW